MGVPPGVPSPTSGIPLGAAVVTGAWVPGVVSSSAVPPQEMAPRLTATRTAAVLQGSIDGGAVMHPPLGSRLGVGS